MRTAQVTDNGVQDMIQTVPESLRGLISNPDSTDGKIMFAPANAAGFASSIMLTTSSALLTLRRAPLFSWRTCII